MENNKYNGRYNEIAELINEQHVVVGKTNEAIKEVCSLVESHIEDLYEKEPTKYIEYIIKRLRRGDRLSIWGLGNPILRANVNIFERLEALKNKYENIESQKNTIQSINSTKFSSQPEDYSKTLLSEKQKSKKALELTEQQSTCFERAIKAGLMEKTNNGYIWIHNNGLKASLAYFLEKVFAPKGTEQMPYHSLEIMFNVSRLDSTLTQVHNAKNPQKWITDIDKIFTN